HVPQLSTGSGSPGHHCGAGRAIPLDTHQSPSYVRLISRIILQSRTVPVARGMPPGGVHVPATRIIHHQRIALPEVRMSEPLLKIIDLHAEVAEEGTEILKGVNLELNEGEIHAIMGPNGSGKSTPSKVISGHPAYEVTDG